MTRIVFLTLDGGGNVAPAVAIAHQLMERGHRVRFLGASTQQRRLEAEGFEVEPYRSATPWDPGTPKSGLAGVLAFRTLLADRAYAADLATALDEERADVAVVDALMPASAAAATRLGIPVVVLMHSFAQFFRGSPAFAALGLSRGVNVRHAWESADLTLVASDRELDPAGSKTVPARLRWTGVAEPIPAAPASATGGAPRVLVSLSTVAAPDQRRVLQLVLDAVAGMPVQVIVTTGPALDPKSVHPGVNTTVLREAPHSELLPRCSAVIGHGGHSTTMRALLHGVPLVLIPCDERIDQPIIARAVHQAGAGIHVSKRASVEHVREALAEVLRDDSYRRAAASIGDRLRAQHGAERAADAVLELAASGARTAQA